MWSVLIAPCLVATVVPSISGRRSRWTPSRETSAPPRALAGADLVDLVEKDDAVALDLRHRVLNDGVLVEQLLGLGGDQRLMGVRHRHALGPGALTFAEDIGDVDCADRRAGHVRQFEHRQPGPALRQFDLDFLVVEFALRAACGERSRGWRRTRSADERVEHPLFRRKLGLGLDVLALAALDQSDRDLDQIAHDLLDVAPDIADLGEFGRLDLEERRAGELGEAPRDLGLAAAGRADHQDVLGHHLLAHRRLEAKAAPPVAQRNGDGALGLRLTDNIAVEFGHDFTGRQIRHEVRDFREPD